MNKEDFDFLTQKQVQALIEANLEVDPQAFALSQKNNVDNRAIVPSQIKNLQKARKKIPSFYRARCIIPDQAYEQCSSEKTAKMRNFTGKTCLDLTCGLGVDTFIYTQNFQSVTSLEKNSVYSEVAKYNFQKLGVTNVQIINTSAEEFLNQYSGPSFDLIYADPSRRDSHGNRLQDLYDFSPNITSILPLLKNLTSRILFKLSPLFDLNEARRIFPEASDISIISINNECKELLVEINQTDTPPSSGSPVPLNIMLNKQDEEYTFVFSETIPAPPKNELPLNEYSYLLEADVAFYKGRTNEALYQKYFPEIEGIMNHENGFFFSNGLSEKLSFPGRIFKIISVFPYKPKAIKKELKKRGIKKINITRRYFPFSVKEIRKSLMINDGGDKTLICTQWKGKKMAFLVITI
jgi:hypothetical protein